MQCVETLAASNCILHRVPHGSFRRDTTSLSFCALSLHLSLPTHVLTPEHAPCGHVRMSCAQVISMTARLLDGGDDGVCGVLTSGGTESIILTVRAHRDFHRQVLPTVDSAPTLFFESFAYCVAMVGDFFPSECDQGCRSTQNDRPGFQTPALLWPRWCHSECILFDQKCRQLIDF